MSFDPIESASKGAIKGALEWGTDLIKELASKLRDKKLSFIQDEEIIKRVKEQYKSGELSIYKEYINNKEMLFLLQMGLTLRSLENDESRRRNLRSKIFDKYNVKGLHIAQLVENGILNRYIGILMEGITSIEKFKKDLVNVLENVEKHVLFVQKIDSERGIIMKASNIAGVHLPMIFIVSGISSAAEIVKNCEARLKEILKEYNLEKISSNQKESLFFKRTIV